MENGYSICLNKWALDKDIKSELGLLLIISSLCAEKGYCYANNKYLAELFGISEVAISQRIKKLEGKGYIDISYKKRGCEIISREIRLKLTLTDDLRKLKPTIKENLKENNTRYNNIPPIIPPGGNDNQADQRYDSDEEDFRHDFEILWSKYPRKDGKINAYKHYKSWMKGKDTAFGKIKLTNEQMLSAIESYCRELKARGVTEKKYIKMADTFFNNCIYDYVPKEDDSG